MKKIFFLLILLIVACKKEQDNSSYNLKILGDEFVYEGDSITAVADVMNYPIQLALLNTYIARMLQINVASSGDHIQSMINEYSSQVAPHKPTLFGQKYYFFIMAGTNDASSGRTSTQIYDDLKTEWGYARKDGFKVVAMCITRSTDPARDSAAIAVNKLIKADPTLYDHLIKTDELLPDAKDLNYFLPDGVHPNQQGAIMIAKEIIIVLSKPL